MDKEFLKKNYSEVESSSDEKYFIVTDEDGKKSLININENSLISNFSEIIDIKDGYVKYTRKGYKGEFKYKLPK